MGKNCGSDQPAGYIEMAFWSSTGREVEKERNGEWPVDGEAEERGTWSEQTRRRREGKWKRIRQRRGRRGETRNEPIYGVGLAQVRQSERK